MTSRRYQLIEALPYPRSTRQGPLRDVQGVPLHGTYERSLADRYRAAIVNNGTVVHRYDYRSSLVGCEMERTRSFTNLVHTLDPWLAPGDAERPVTEYPASESRTPWSWRPLWHEPFILDSVLRDVKPVGLLHGGPGDTEHWTATARSHGLLAHPVRAWVDGLGRPRTLTLVSRPGPLASSSDVRRLQTEYSKQLPSYPLTSACKRLALMTGEDLAFPDLVNPVSADDLVVSGFCFGYPVASTAACITGEHS